MTVKTEIQKGLLDYCKNNHQSAIIASLVATQSVKASSEDLNLTYEQVKSVLQRVRATAQLQGYSPEHKMTNPVPDTHSAKRISTLYDAEGRVKQQWVIANEKKDNIVNELNIIAEELKKEIRPCRSVISNCEISNSNLVNTYVITDYHLGALAWGEETRGENWDIDIAEDLLVSWFEKSIETSPKARTAIFAQLGDFLHWDGLMPVTPTSGHILDADTRFQLLVRVAIRVIIKITKMLLEKYENVHLLMAEGNHDISSSIWLREMLAHYFSDNPRITVDVSPDPYYCYEHGNTSLFFHHGHKSGLKKLSSVFAGKFRDVFGRTKYSYAHTGHLHHVDVKEDNMMILEQHQTLAANDSHGSRGGYQSQRGALVITYHKKYGEVGRVRTTPEMVK